MSGVSVTDAPIVPRELEDALAHPAAGARVSFEGRVRDHNEGRRVERLEYEAYTPLAEKEGARILAEAAARWPIIVARCVHRIGPLQIGECAVWVGVSSAHRDEAFAACRYIIDELKLRLPIWKKEYYTDGDSGWVSCERCARHAHGDAREEAAVSG